MSRQVYTATFTREEDLLAATGEIRSAGVRIYDVYTPYAVHGLDAAMGLKSSRLTWVCFGAGAFGLAFGLWLQVYASAESWPLNVGGKPFNSLPAFVPVAFELTVLCAALTTVLALLVRTKLRPRIEAPRGQLPGVTNDKLTLVVEMDDRFSEEAFLRTCGAHGVVEMGPAEVPS